MLEEREAVGVECRAAARLHDVDGGRLEARGRAEGRWTVHGPNAAAGWFAVGAGGIRRRNTAVARGPAGNALSNGRSDKGCRRTGAGGAWRHVAGNAVCRGGASGVVRGRVE